MGVTSQRTDSHGLANRGGRRRWRSIATSTPRRARRLRRIERARPCANTMRRGRRAAAGTSPPRTACPATNRSPSPEPCPHPPACRRRATPHPSAIRRHHHHRHDPRDPDPIAARPPRRGVCRTRGIAGDARHDDRPRDRSADPGAGACLRPCTQSARAGTSRRRDRRCALAEVVLEPRHGWLVG